MPSTKGLLWTAGIALAVVYLYNADMLPGPLAKSS